MARQVSAKWLHGVPREAEAGSQHEAAAWVAVDGAVVGHAAVALLDQVGANAASAGAALALDVVEHDVGAMRTYERRGWIRVGEAIRRDARCCAVSRRPRCGRRRAPRR